ncbi:PP2C family protein-serine/threonine phosphatase [Nocardiopsis sp. NRRL B-16309]|uniref:PP2C family protein-serine/threonine phosphatase n=1 Tax=Nocardiopsis sp. NRRL B-16309 TaxID=1519494 RepID=UPI0006AFF706|nr:PP2C family protein-serine/threonine phosphatase [Nocardiopsis sp. NRRL B-16309]KOX15401.1 stage II sporulation protein E [Nocardiopsis sp. NRRL B-16309]
MSTPCGIDTAVATLALASHRSSFTELPALVAREAARAGLPEARLFIADRQERFLREVTGEGPDAHRGGAEMRVDGTVAGLAYTKGEPVRVDRGHRCWVPVLDGTERLGVLHVANEGEPDFEAMRILASMVGLLVVDKRANSDAYARLIRTRPMSVSAEMQWSLMPPSTFANTRVTISAATEPAYDNAGDAFDYALSGDIAHLAMFDAMGHDNAAGLLANLTVGVFRNERRRGTELEAIPRAVETMLTEEFARTRFTTAVMGELNMATGDLAWVNCGHLPPVLIRGGKAHELECEPSHPLGTELGLPVTVCHEQLEPGDRLLLYTDGMIEARDAQGREFGLDRFVDFVIRHDADRLPVPETLRRLVQALMNYHHGRLDDDATVLFCEWHG